VIPIGARALKWLERYLEDVRPELIVSMAEHALFLSSYGEAFNPDVLSRKVSKYIKQADIGRGGSCHLFRHTCATLMHENGADIRFIQQLLGHADLSTTQIYTQVAIRKLKEIHTATHPAKVGNTVLDELKAELEDDDS
jgi:integrase/recombinase XerD